MRRSFAPKDLHAEARGPIRLADHGIFWTGIEQVRSEEGTRLRGQSCVEFFIPEQLTQDLPIVILHGGGQALDFLSTADGRPGWVQFFVNHGYAVYLLNQPGTGRAPAHPELEGPFAPPIPYEALVAMLVAPEAAPGSYPQARLHDQWPGVPSPGDPATDAFIASSEPFKANPIRFQRDVVRGAVEALDKIGPCILLTMSAGAVPGWLVADARPGVVRLIAAIEPFGPPVTGIAPMTLPWGLAGLPLRYEPEVGAAEELRFELAPPPGPDRAACMLQAEPARRLPNLAGLPIGVFTAEASWMVRDNHGTVAYLRQAGCAAEQIYLADHGVRGNGHLVMLERNSDDAAAVVQRWIEQKMAAGGSVSPRAS